MVREIQYFITAIEQAQGTSIFEIEYQIDGGTWTNPKGAQTNNYYTAIQNGVEESVSVSVPSDSTISWRYKDTLSVNALSTKSFELATPTPLSVLWGLLEQQLQLDLVSTEKPHQHLL